MRLSEGERWCTHVLKGTELDSCWLWTGAISDDRYGRLWIRTFHGQKVIAAHRFAPATVHGGAEPIENRTALHRCDVPLCVRASLAPSTHLLPGTCSANMADRALEKRMPSPNAVKGLRICRAQWTARSRHLRDELEAHGWDQDLIRRLVHDLDPDHPTLLRAPRGVAPENKGAATSHAWHPGPEGSSAGRW